MQDKAMSQPTHTEPADESAEAAAAVDRARALVGEAVAELMSFWNFKPSMGRVWTALYLSPEPLSADSLVARTGLSVGSVSMTLSDLRDWGVVSESGRVDGKRCYVAGTDIVSMVSRVFREREMVMISDAMSRFSEAIRLLDAHGRSSAPGQMMESRFVATRVQRLHGLSRAGQRMVEQLVRVGRVDMATLRNKLKRGR
jgi:DNA-binding transcriptional regulator GbsR (MarR family)